MQSWGSGYLIFQFMVPVTQFYGGAAIAGELGLTLTIVRALQSVASSWGMTKVPIFNILVAQRKRDELNSLFKQVQWQSLSIYILGAIALIFIVIYLFPLIGWSNRVLPAYAFVILFIAELGHLQVFNWAYYLRSHKKEPYVYLSVLSATAIGIGVWASMYFYNSIMLLISVYCILTLISLILAFIIFIKKKKEYNKLI